MEWGGFHFIDAAFVAAALKLGVEEDVQNFLGELGGVVLAPRQRTLALLCWRESAAMDSSKTSAARMPGILLAAMLMPTPVVQISRPSLAFCAMTVCATAAAKSG